MGLPDCKHLQQVQGVLQWQFQAFKNSHRNEHFPTLVMNRAVQATTICTIKHGKSYRRSRLSLVIWVPTKVLLQLHAANEPTKFECKTFSLSWVPFSAQEQDPMDCPTQSNHATKTRCKISVSQPPGTDLRICASKGLHINLLQG